MERRLCRTVVEERLVVDHQQCQIVKTGVFPIMLGLLAHQIAQRTQHRLLVESTTPNGKRDPVPFPFALLPCGVELDPAKVPGEHRVRRQFFCREDRATAPISFARPSRVTVEDEAKELLPEPPGVRHCDPSFWMKPNVSN